MYQREPSEFGSAQNRGRRCSPSWTLDQPGYRPTLGDRRDDAKFNVAEIGAVNMGEIGAVRKRSR